jgi:hypothetical protein
MVADRATLEFRAKSPWHKNPQPGGGVMMIVRSTTKEVAIRGWRRECQQIASALTATEVNQVNGPTDSVSDLRLCISDRAYCMDPPYAF